MSDISRIVDEWCAWFDAVEPVSVSTLPTSGAGRGNVQVHVIADFSHTSHTSRTGNETPQKTEQAASENAENSARGSRVASSYAGDVGSVGSVGSGAETLAGSTLLPFPQDLKEVGSVGMDGGLCGQFPDQSRLTSPPADPLPISAADVRAGVARELRSLAEDGREGPTALRDAVAITAAKIRNSPALVERQIHDGRCHACDGALDDTRPVVAVLQHRGRLWVHGGECHDALSQRRAALVETIMAAAGYGAETEGEAA